MATAPFDAELMTQQVAAIAVPPSHDFSAVRDEKGALMMFSLGINGVFYVVKDDANGARVMVDLGAALGLPPGSVTAFAVTQSPTDSTLYLVVAAVTTSTAQTDLFVLKPFAPSVIDVTQPTLNLESYVIPNAGGGPTSSISAFQLFLVSPCLFLLPLVAILWDAPLGLSVQVSYLSIYAFTESAGYLGQ